jgi:hypothetical protein
MGDFMTLWGYMVPYQASYMLQFSAYNTSTNLQLVMIFFFVGHCLTALTFRRIIYEFGYKYGILLTQLLKTLGLLCFAWFTPLLLVYLSAILAGAGWSGFITLSSFFILEATDDESSGFFTSLVLSGLGLSGIFWSWIMYQVINPTGINPTIIVKEGEFTTMYFEESVANNVPTYWVVFGLNMLIWTLIIIPFIEEKPDMVGRLTVRMRAKWYDWVETKEV